MILIRSTLTSFIFLAIIVAFAYAEETALVATGKPNTLVEYNTGVEFIWVDGGCYTMGCSDWMIDCSDDEKPPHEVCVNGFWMGKYEVTQGQWEKIMGNNPSTYPASDQHPVEMVSLEDTQLFIGKLNRLNGNALKVRLPTEAEWEYAARSGGKQEIYAGGNSKEEGLWHPWQEGTRFYANGQTYPVGTAKPNGLGLFDMTGNVYEWVQDWYDSKYYQKSPKKNPAGPQKGKFKVIRGGHHPNKIKTFRTTSRYYHAEPSWSCYDLGFRLVAELQPRR
jgi:formylglycine-generating enzyme required for sulfatase activity